MTVKHSAFVAATTEQATFTGNEKIALVDTDGSGVTEHAQIDGAFDSRYAPLWVPASAFRVSTGSPNEAIQSARWDSWRLDANVDEQVTASINLPSVFTTITVTLLWSNPAAGSGDVSWRLTLDRAAEGGTGLATSGSGYPLVTVTAAAQDQLVKTVLVTDAAVSSADILGLRVLRNAVAGTDTLGNDASLIGVYVEPA